MADFRTKYWEKNEPVLIRNVSFDWPARIRWLQEETLRKEYGEGFYSVGRIPPELPGKERLKDYLTLMREEGARKVRHPIYLWDRSLDGTCEEKGTLLNGQRHMIEDTEVP